MRGWGVLIRGNWAIIREPSARALEAMLFE